MLLSWRNVKRILVFIVGVFILSLGIAISVRANLGTTPIASFPTVLSFATPWSLGTYLILVNLVFFVLQIPILGRNFRPFQFVQVPITLGFGIFADISMYLTQWLDTDNYLAQWGWTIAGAFLVALGVYIETQPRLSYVPGDGFVFALTQRLQNIPFGTIKIVVDGTLVVIAVITSFLLLGRLEGVREGTIFAAFAVGFLLKMIHRIHQRFKQRPE